MIIIFIMIFICHRLASSPRIVGWPRRRNLGVSASWRAPKWDGQPGGDLATDAKDRGAADARTILWRRALCPETVHGGSRHNAARHNHPKPKPKPDIEIVIGAGSGIGLGFGFGFRFPAIGNPAHPSHFRIPTDRPPADATARVPPRPAARCANLRVGAVGG
jgi:hypothetical protein